MEYPVNIGKGWVKAEIVDDPERPGLKIARLTDKKGKTITLSGKSNQAYIRQIIEAA